MSKPRVIIELEDLIEQATKERSHYYVKSVCEKSILAIGMLQHENETIAKAYAELLKRHLSIESIGPLAIENQQLRAELEDALAAAFIHADEHRKARREIETLRAQLEIAKEALEQIEKYSTMVGYPEHELNHALGVEIPHICNEAIAKLEELEK